ncbi:hypothetical protein P3T36_003690 [Kitasatospora sp. MAP12-15]|uniref:hypothetical protein n=1 Tax=unclassified Kitasatospora TaxID=2633591 RepID=UPI002474C909|nr:hypothetical protein [Kitasatospora sp. MAP12-44]MDH6112278.1 hypothetical protein [Kitasatospora sp. MAP12-44]
MAGGQSDGQPEGRPDGLTGGLSGGEWWRVDGPWRVFGDAVPPQEAPVEAPDDDGVYVADAPPVAGSALPRSGPTLAKPLAPPGPEIPRERSRSIFHKRPVPAPPGLPPTPEEAPAAWLIAPASPGPVLPPTVADFPGWDAVHIEFPPDDTEPPEPPAPVEELAPPVPADTRSRWIPRQRRSRAAAEPAAQLPRGLLAGRRPSPLLLLSAAVLVGGSVTGLVLVMLAGWVLGYLSKRLGELTKRFAVLGIPLLTMTGSALWFWGRSQGRWGAPLGKGAPLTHAVFSSTPGVLRLAAVLSALFLLTIALRRRREV